MSFLLSLPEIPLLGLLERRKQATASLATNSEGIYDATALPPGSWSIPISKTGLGTEIRRSIYFEVRQVARMDFTLVENTDPNYGTYLFQPSMMGCSNKRGTPAVMARSMGIISLR